MEIATTTSALREGATLPCPKGRFHGVATGLAASLHRRPSRHRSDRWPTRSTATWCPPGTTGY